MPGDGCARCARGGDPWLGGLVVGSRVMIVALLVISISSPQFNVKGEVAVIALLMAMAEVAGSLLRGDGEPDRARSAGASRRVTSAARRRRPPPRSI